MTLSCEQCYLSKWQITVIPFTWTIMDCGRVEAVARSRVSSFYLGLPWRQATIGSTDYNNTDPHLR